MPTSQQEPAYRNPQLPVEQRVDDLLGRMTVEEKVAQLQTSFSAIAHLVDENGNFDPEKAEESLQALRKAASFLRSRLGKELRLRHVPELHFVHDDSVEKGSRIDELIARALYADKD